MTLPTLATSRYQNGTAIVRSGLVPVRTSNGYPPFRLPYELSEVCRLLMPNRSIIHLTDPNAFATIYLAKVERHWDEIVSQLEATSAHHGGAGLVLLCFEDLSKDWCHRRILADYITERTGQMVKEL